MTLAKSQDLFSVIVCLGTSETLSPQTCKAIASCSSPAPALAGLFFFVFLSSEQSNPSSLICGYWSSFFFGIFLFLFPFSKFARASTGLLFSLFFSFKTKIQVLGFGYGFPVDNAYICFQSLEPSPKVKGRFSAGFFTIYFRFNQFQTWFCLFPNQPLLLMSVLLLVLTSWPPSHPELKP